MFIFKPKKVELSLLSLQGDKQQVGEKMQSFTFVKKGR